jgi:hypothetical protein
MATPTSNQLGRCLTHRHCHLDRALRRVGTWHRVVEEHHDPVARELVERALKLARQWPQRAVVLAQKFEDFLRLSGLGEGGIAAQIAEHDDDVAAMAFEDLFVPLRDDQLRKLRCQKPFQPSDTAQFIDLLGDTRFEAAVQLGDLVGTLTQFTQQAGVLHRDDRLTSKVLQ